MAHIVENEHKYRPLVADRSWADFVRDVGSDGVWLETGVELQAIADVHNTDLVVRESTRC